MKTVLLHPFQESVLVKTDSRVCDSLLARQVDVGMACGGQGLCATCHVYVTAGEDSLNERTDRENRTLAMISHAKPCSRLSCQARVLGEGVQVEMPEGIYADSVNHLLSLVGKRAEVPVLHPRDGRILIEKGKIITKSRILELHEKEGDELFQS